MKRCVGILLSVAVGLLMCTMAWSQGIFATVTGTVQDPSGAVIPGAQVTLTNVASGTVRQGTANAQGYYTFASVPVGSYKLTVTSPGFQRFDVSGITLGGGELRTINAKMKIGTSSQTVQVSSAGDMLTPVSTGEQTDTLRTVQLQNYVQTGSNAGEFMKIMPGFGVNNGVSNSSKYSGQTIGINNSGSAGTQSPLGGVFSIDGLPTNTMDIVSDGAHVSDPGCNCDTPINPNSDFLQEFKVLTSAFSAEDQKGPVVITSVTKAGGTQYHGNAFFSARNYELNSNDAYNKAIGLSRPQFAYYYSGGSIGGPVLRRPHNKLFFFAGFEYFYQALNTGALTATVPTSALINGDFSPAALSALGAKTASGGAPGSINSSTQTAWGGTTMPSTVIDPSMQALMKLYPKPNADPNASGGFNYVDQVSFNQNDTQLVTRVDYDISNSTKLWARWSHQTDKQPFIVQLWGSSIDQIPYPSQILGNNSSDSIASTLTHVFSPTLTNEFVFAYTQVLFPNSFTNPKAIDPANVGYSEPSLFAHDSTKAPNPHQIPNFGGKSGTPSEAALISNRAGFEWNGGHTLFANKYMPSMSDTLTKVWRTHTFAAGVFWEWIRNSQPDNQQTNGTMEFYPADNPNFTYGDAYADMLGGNLTSYSEFNRNRLYQESYNTYEAFVQDSWQVTPKFTLNYGVRFSHFQPWQDERGYGFSVFDPSQYSNANGGACAKGPNFCGFEWHSRNPAVPLGGFPTRALFYQPRVGVAYDLHGNGNTVIRGGWGYFYYHTGQFTSGLETSAGSEGITLNPAHIGNQQLLAKNLGNTSFQAVPPTPTAVGKNDNKQPYTEEYNLSIDQRTPWEGLFSIAYIGNVSRDLPNFGGYGSNINLVPFGAMLSDPNNPGLDNPDPYRPMVGYSDVNVIVNNLYSNYNGVQVKWAHQGKGQIIQLNYTWGKALGIVNPAGSNLNNGGATINPFDLRANYGPLVTDRRNIFNAAYSINLPSPIHGGNPFASGLVNGWQISGTTSLQSGANLTGNAGNYNFNTNAHGAIIPGSVSGTNPKGIPINSQSIYGSPDAGNGNIIPMMTCNPTSNLGSHQFVNASCFALPTSPVQAAPGVLPAVYGPAYFNSDLGIFKNFQVGSREASRLQIRVQAQNFLNHPLYSYPNTNNLKLNFTQDPNTGAITQTNSQFGVTQYKQGARIVQFEAKYYF